MPSRGRQGRRGLLLFVGCLGCLFLAGCLPETGVTLSIVLEPVSGYAPLPVRVEARGAEALTPPLVFEWTFEDSVTADGPVAEHLFVGKGTATVRVTVTDANGRTASAEAAVRLLNRLPHAEFTYQPYQPPTHQPVRFDASASYDPDGTIVGYTWDFGDGTLAHGATVTHAFETPGVSYQVVLTVTDDTGDENQMYRWVEPIGCDH